MNEQGGEMDEREAAGSRSGAASRIAFAARRSAGRRAAGLALIGCAAAVAATGTERPRSRPGLVFESQRLQGPAGVEGAAAQARLLYITDIGNIRLALSNAGTMGTSFNSRDTPSMEWPARSGIDHLVRGALWVGAISVATGETLVTTAGRDAYYLDAIFDHSEFTPTEGRPQEFSRQRTSPFFRAGTVSDENIHTAFVDTLDVRKLTGEQRHRPMGIKVVQESYGWGFDPLDDFVILEFNIVNVGRAVLQDVYVGVYTEMASNNRLAWALWPPGGTWFDFQDPAWDSTNCMINNHQYYFGGGRAKPWAGLKLVGTGGHGPFGRGPDSLATKTKSIGAWTWSPSQFLVWKDDSLYTFMSSGKINNFDEFDPLNTDINPSSIFSVGPFSFLAPGDTVQAVFAFLAGNDLADLKRNAAWVQKAYDDKYALPSPPSSPILHLYPEHHDVVLRWSAQPEDEKDPATKDQDFAGYRVWLSSNSVADSFRLVGQWDKGRDPGDFNTGLDSITRRDPVTRLEAPYIDEGWVRDEAGGWKAVRDTLKYELRLGGVPDGFKRYAAVTSYDWQPSEPHTLMSGVLQNSIYFVAGPSAAQARRQKVSVFPNPYRGESALDGRDLGGNLNPRKRVMWFVNLPSRCTLKIYTLAGDLVRTYEYDAAIYRGTEAGGIRPDNADLATKHDPIVTGGAMLAFDLLSDNGQEIASGLYLFAVQDRATGESQQGKFLVLK